MDPCRSAVLRRDRCCMLSRSGDRSYRGINDTCRSAALRRDRYGILSLL